MAPLPLPTDNLYKFCALTGVVLLVLFFWKTSELKDEYAAKSIEFDSVSQKLAIEQKILEATLEKRRAELSELEKAISAGNPSTDKIQEVTRKTDESGRLVREQQLRSIDFKAVSSNLHLIMEHRFELLYVSIFVFIGAGLLSIYGFKNWRRLQLKQDELLDLQLKEARKDLGDR